jgi:hypothetical protein
VLPIRRRLHLAYYVVGKCGVLKRCEESKGTFRRSSARIALTGLRPVALLISSLVLNDLSGAERALSQPLRCQQSPELSGVGRGTLECASQTNDLMIRIGASSDLRTKALTSALRCASAGKTRPAKGPVEPKARILFMVHLLRNACGETCRCYP